MPTRRSNSLAQYTSLALLPPLSLLLQTLTPVQVEGAHKARHFTMQHSSLPVVFLHSGHCHASSALSLRPLPLQTLTLTPTQVEGAYKARQFTMQ